MPTMGEAARSLGIGRVTLEKWCKRLDIEPARHPFDYRFYTLTDDQVDQIREARRQMPNARPDYTAGYTPIYPRIALRAKSERGGYSGAGGARETETADASVAASAPRAPGAWRTTADAIRFLARHGPAENTARFWYTSETTAGRCGAEDWATPAGALRWAIAYQAAHPRGQRISALRRCGDPACECVELLDG